MGCLFLAGHQVEKVKRQLAQLRRAKESAEKAQAQAEMARAHDAAEWAAKVEALEEEHRRRLAMKDEQLQELQRDRDVLMEELSVAQSVPRHEAPRSRLRPSSFGVGLTPGGSGGGGGVSARGTGGAAGAIQAMMAAAARTAPGADVSPSATPSGASPTSEARPGARSRVWAEEGEARAPPPTPAEGLRLGLSTAADTPLGGGGGGMCECVPRPSAQPSHRGERKPSLTDGGVQWLPPPPPGIVGSPPRCPCTRPAALPPGPAAPRRPAPPAAGS